MANPFYNRFPFTTLNDINLDWIIKRVKELGEQFAGQAEDISYAVLTANHADATATSARNAATNAQNAATVALERANSVQGIAADALATAQAALDTAEDAETTANAIAGTANNALSVAQGAQETASNALTTAQDAVDTAQAASATAIAASADANNAEQSAQTAINTAQAALTIANSAAGLSFTDTATGEIATFPDGLPLPAIALSTVINPLQSGSGDPSPTNIRNFIAYIEANIAVSPTQYAQDGTIYTIQFGAAGSVYGCIIDVINGVLSIIWILTTINNELWAYNATNGHFSTTTSSPLQSKRKPGRTNLKSSAYLTTNASSSASAPNYSLRGNSNVSQIYVKDTRFTDVPSWKAVMGDTQIVYELADPIIITLTPIDVAILAGTNNVWSDTNGETTVTYHADPQKWIEKKLAEVEAIVLEN